MISTSNSTVKANFWYIVFDLEQMLTLMQLPCKFQVAIIKLS